MKTCSIRGCSDPHNAKGLCNTHYNRWKRHKSFDKPVRPSQAGVLNYNWQGNKASYTTVHSRLKTVKGQASSFLCTDCGETALDWAYTYGCPNERASKFGPYTTDLDRYQPMCRRCHRKFDYHAGQVAA